MVVDCLTQDDLKIMMINCQASAGQWGSCVNHDYDDHDSHNHNYDHDHYDDEYDDYDHEHDIDD